MSKKKDAWAGMLIPGCLLVGIGIGLAINQVASGTLIGLGVGFIAAFITRKMA